MKDRLLDVLKWAIIIVIAAAAFYVVFPKYQFIGIRVRGNRITGAVEIYTKAKGWHSLETSEEQSFYDEMLEKYGDRHWATERYQRAMKEGAIKGE